MKVKVTLQIKANEGENKTFELVVGSTDTVLNVKERVSALQLVPFHDQDLKFDGEVLTDGKRLSECGIKEGASLDIEVKTSESSFVRQLSEMLQARDLSADELGLLYCYKYGLSITQALKIVGHTGKFQDFLAKQKLFLVENGRVTLVREDSALKPFSVADEVAQLLKANMGSMDIKDLSTKFVQKFNVSMASISGMKPAEFLGKQRDLFVVSGRMVSLKEAHISEEPKPQRVGPAPWNVKPATQQIAAVLPPGLEPEVAIQVAGETEAVDSQQYLDLHSRVCGRSFNSKIAQTLSDIVEAVSEISFLNVDRVVKGGSIGKGSAITGISDAEVVFFLHGLPTVAHDKWLPPLLKAVTGVLSEQLGAEHGVEGLHSTEDSVQMKVKGLVTVDLRFSPVFESYAQVIEAIGKQGPEVRRHYAASLVHERTQFIAKQPGHVKVTIRLLKWWRDQQEWSNKLLRPSDVIIELLSVYSAVQTRPADQRAAVANVLNLMSQFNDLRIVWSNYYSKDDVWSPLLRQRPLLMDPTNPFINIADPQLFDARELMSLAQTTHFFW